ncbi:tail fiber domain-containing protein [Microbacterium sp. BR1]|uniref:tail fiber domain-containing protein n=1 Tax=Microbacterium sp. BR1 TaxID=1070896 RepID=UPI000C2B848E|nr:tail fiber domain-containing protein [Microbacterium sp. BR1]
MVSRVPETTRFGRQNKDREETDKGTRDALRFDGSQFVRLYEKMQALIANLVTTVTDLVNDLVPSLTYTKSEIDSKIASPGAIAPTTVTTSGNVNVTGSVTTSGTVQVGGQLRAPDIISFNITGTRRTLWGEDSTGRIGYASSSERAKTNIAPAVIDPRAVLSIEPVVFEYIAQIAEHERRAALPSPYADWNPSYPVALELGFIAERLVDAGLSQFVIFGADGQPEGIEYSMWVVAQQSVLRWIVERLDTAGI